MDLPTEGSSMFLEQLMLRSCALRCVDVQGRKRDCVKGCSLAAAKPLNAALLSYSILGLEDQEMHEEVLSPAEQKTAENRLLSICLAINRGCVQECTLHCHSSKNRECFEPCTKGCKQFVDAILSNKLQ